MDTWRDLITALGGTVAVQRALGFRYPSSVSNWMRGGIPRQHWPALLEIGGDKVSLETLRRLEGREEAA